MRAFQRVSLGLISKVKVLITHKYDCRIWQKKFVDILLHKKMLKAKK